MSEERYAVGVDIGGTKLNVALVDGSGVVMRRVKIPTGNGSGPSSVISQITGVIRELMAKCSPSEPFALGVGIAGQIDSESGTVLFAPNLKWHDVPLRSELETALNMKTLVINDVRAATWGEWLHGAGTGCTDLVCLFVGTGIGGGIVSGGQMLSGCSNSSGELGHVTIDMNGPACHCGNRGCLEALAGGWAIARQAQQAVVSDPEGGAPLIILADGRIDDISAETVARAFHDGDPFAARLVDDVARALVAGVIGIVNSLNPCRLILGGGVIEGLPGLISRIEKGVREKALPSATSALEIVPAELHGDAGVIGAASLAIQSFTKKKRSGA